MVWNLLSKVVMVKFCVLALYTLLAVPYFAQAATELEQAQDIVLGRSHEQNGIRIFGPNVFSASYFSLFDFKALADATTDNLALKNLLNQFSELQNEGIGKEMAMFMDFARFDIYLDEIASGRRQDTPGFDYRNNIELTPQETFEAVMAGAANQLESLIKYQNNARLWPLLSYGVFHFLQDLRSTPGFETFLLDSPHLQRKIHQLLNTFATKGTPRDQITLRLIAELKHIKKDVDLGPTDAEQRHSRLMSVPTYSARMVRNYRLPPEVDRTAERKAQAAILGIATVDWGHQHFNGQVFSMAYFARIDFIPHIDAIESTNNWPLSRVLKRLHELQADGLNWAIHRRLQLRKWEIWSIDRDLMQNASNLNLIGTYAPGTKEKVGQLPFDYERNVLLDDNETLDATLETVAFELEQFLMTEDGPSRKMSPLQSFGVYHVLQQFQARPDYVPELMDSEHIQKVINRLLQVYTSQDQTPSDNISDKVAATLTRLRKREALWLRLKGLAPRAAIKKIAQRPPKNIVPKTLKSAPISTNDNECEKRVLDSNNEDDAE